MASFIERIQAKIELFRLEKRYTRRRNRRSTFVSNAVYVDGEYIYQTPFSTGSSNTSSTTNTSAASASAAAATAAAAAAAGVGGPSNASPAASPLSNKLRNRFSMPAFGSAARTTSGYPNEWQR